MFAPAQFQRMITHLTRPCAGGNLHIVLVKVRYVSKNLDVVDKSTF